MTSTHADYRLSQLDQLEAPLRAGGPASPLAVKPFTPWAPVVDKR